MKDQEVKTENVENQNLPAAQGNNVPDNVKMMDVGGGESFSPTEIITVDKNALKKAEVASINMSLEYHEFVQGEEVRGVYLGMTTHKCADRQNPGEEKILAAAVFIDENGNPKINSATKFVDAVYRFKKKQVFAATHTRIKKTSTGGNMQLFDVRKLDMEI